jgi:transposase
VSNGVVHGYVRRARLAGLTWPLPEGMDDEGLELLLLSRFDIGVWHPAKIGGNVQITCGVCAIIPEIRGLR